MLSTILDARARSRVEKKDLAVCMYVYVDICIQKIARVSARIYFSFSFSLFLLFTFCCYGCLCTVCTTVYLLYIFVYGIPVCNFSFHFKRRNDRVANKEGLFVEIDRK